MSLPEVLVGSGEPAIGVSGIRERQRGAIVSFPSTNYRIAIVLGAVVGNHAIQLRHAMKPQFDLPSHHVR